jgi:hypothetical protein
MTLSLPSLCNIDDMMINESNVEHLVDRELPWETEVLGGNPPQSNLINDKLHMTWPGRKIAV